MFTMNRNGNLPRLAIIMVPNTSGNIPTGLTQETSLNGNYLKGIPTAVTEPDVTFGTANHIHDADGDHGHTATVPSHTHTGTHTGAPQFTGTAGGFAVSKTNPSHTHAFSTSSQAVAEAATSTTHTHDSLTNDVEHRTVAFYKKTVTSKAMTSKSLPRNMMFFYSKTALPDGFLEEVAYRLKHIKGASTSGSNSGSNTHTHNSEGSHTHNLNISAHTHSVGFGGASGTAEGSSINEADFSRTTHQHADNTASTGPKSGSAVASGSGGSHTHTASLDKQPAFRTLMLLEVNVLNMTSSSLPKNVICTWLDALNLIPSAFDISDGNNGTINMLDKYPKGDATPDSTGGSNTHTHSNESGTHAHSTASVAHTHNSPTGVSGAGTTTVRLGDASSFSGARDTHTHGVSTVTGGSPQTVTVVSGASNHTHGAENSEPSGRTVAFIQRTGT